MLDQIRISELDPIGNGVHRMPEPYTHLLVGVTPAGDTAVAPISAVLAHQDVGEPIEEAFWAVVDFYAEIDTPEAISVRGWAGTHPEAA
ncbi:hypothetical protein [Thioalkalivibrio sp. ALE20]|uniref:hypothetical protein n=1 Tax=Thioalkalivibrio sp. ALE20 TaxID=545275 RepID=UPI00037D817D|nr:hypothetical protein [Thioalkalivibrio sp. ALE20]